MTKWALCAALAMAGAVAWPAGHAAAAGAVAFRTWSSGLVHQHVEPGESASATDGALASAMAGNPALWGSAWAHTGDWWSLHLHDAPEVRIRVQADDPAALAPGLSLWAIGNDAPFDGGTTGFGGEVSNAGFGTPHSFNAFGALGDPGTLWMAEGYGGNARQLIAFAISGPSFLDATGWGESIATGFHDQRPDDSYVQAITGSVGPGFAELVLTDFTTGWFALYVGGTDHALSGGAFSLSVTSVPEPGTALLLGLGVAALTGLRRR
jgi:hypothetical protein